MSANWFLPALSRYGDRPALICDGVTWSYADLVNQAQGWIDRELVYFRPVIGIVGDFGLEPIGLLLAAIHTGKVVVPLSPAVKNMGWYWKTAQVEMAVKLDAVSCLLYTDYAPTHPLLRQLTDVGTPGLVVFSSGSTGTPKAMLFDVDRLLEKYRTPRPAMVTLAFLLFDHLGGLNTMFHVLANGGTLVTVLERTPDAVCEAVERHHVEVLPTSPTFLNLILMSEAYRRYDLSSLKLVTYGTEVMPAATLSRVREVLPNVHLKQTYGLSEVSVLGTKSRADDSPWMKVGGEGCETKVVDGRLWVKAQSAMLGYLNAPNPFDAEGWLDTGDMVEQDGEWLRVLGRESDIINVGGLKVYPAEVESVLMQMPGVLYAVAYGMPNILTGYSVAARLVLDEVAFQSSPFAVKRTVREFCMGKLPHYAIPVRVDVDPKPEFSNRFKKIRPKGRRDEA